MQFLSIATTSEDPLNLLLDTQNFPTVKSQAIFFFSFTLLDPFAALCEIFLVFTDATILPSLPTS